MSAIDAIYENWLTLQQEGTDRNISGLVFVEEMATKTLIVAAAGEYELLVTRNVLECYEKIGVPESLTTFAKRHGLDRKYHALFDWDSKNPANRFLSFFGDDFKKKHMELLAADPFAKSLVDFCYINITRNNIVHRGFARVSVDCTFSEAWDKYQSGMRFVDYIRTSF